MTELRGLTGARGVAAWLVVLYHVRLSIAGLPRGAVAALGKGYLAVDFFFLLSGFVIALSWSERLRGGGWAAARAFAWKRVARVWPLHLATLGLTLAIALALAATGRADPADFPPGELPFQIVLLQNWGFTDHPTWNVPAWSISAEAGAYLLFPALATINWRRAPAWAPLAMLAGLLAALYTMFALAGAPTLGTNIAHLGLPRCLLEFSAGTALFALWSRWRDAPTLPAIGCALAVAAGLAGWANGAPETLAAPATFAAALLGLALAGDAPRSPLAAAPLHRLGELSYATYLVHYPLFIAFKLGFVRDAHAIPPALIALYLAMVLAASAALHRLVELPARRWVERLPATLRARAGRLRIHRQAQTTVRPERKELTPPTRSPARRSAPR